MTTDEKRTVCRIVGTLLVSDLELHDTEVRHLENLYEKLDISRDERKTIEASINVDDDVAVMAESLSTRARAELLEELHDAAWADGVLVETEARIIEAIEALLS